MRQYLYLYKEKKENSTDVFLRICRSIEASLHPPVIYRLIVDFDLSRIQRYSFDDNRILIYDDVQSHYITIQTDQPFDLSIIHQEE